MAQEAEATAKCAIGALVEAREVALQAVRDVLPYPAELGSRRAATATILLAPDALYDAAVIAREVGWARSELNLNALRFRASPGAFAKDPAAFERNLGRFIAVARANQLRLMPILFDTGDLLKPLVNNTAVEAYLKVVIKAHADDDTVMGYDLCNECYFTSATKDPGAEHPFHFQFSYEKR